MLRRRHPALARGLSRTRVVVQLSHYYLGVPDGHVSQRDDSLYQFVLEYDRGKPMCDGPSHAAGATTFFATRPFSGSLVGGATSVAGVFLFCLCFGYFVGKPVVDAHKELHAVLSKGKGEGEEEEETDSSEGGPVEEEGDLPDS